MLFAALPDNLDLHATQFKVATRRKDRPRPGIAWAGFFMGGCFAPPKSGTDPQRGACPNQANEP